MKTTEYYISSLISRVSPRVLTLCLAILFALAAGFRSHAQSDPQMTQYWALPSYYNPAAAGSTDFLRIRGGARMQWLGIENAPRSFILSADMPVALMGKKLGVGVNATSESLGLFSTMLINIQANYKFKILKGALSVGVQGGYYDSHFKGTEVFIPDGDDYHEPTDPSIPTQDLAGNTFDLSAGLNYSHKYFDIGISALHILQPKVTLGIDGSETSDAAEYETELPRMFYFTSSGNIPLKNTLFILQPSLLVKTDLTSFSAEVTMRTTFNKFLSFGIGYRWKDAVSAMIGAEFKNFFVGYAYDYPVSAIAKGSSGSHEIVAGYSLKLDFSKKNKNKHRSIRIM
ncbi:MAG: type IX secretion system membrane protein PorP/SprF [Bacteroidales bacterium]|nr:type IX secretion system membrane protein PorP/SprF [Bacteroidales bacterium]